MNNTFTTLADRLGQTPILSTPRESLRRLGLASLGAYSLAAKAGLRALDTLVREGQAFSPKAQRQIMAKSTALSSSVSAALARSEALLRANLVRPLDSFLLATRRDVQELATRVVQPATEVRELAAGRNSAAAEIATVAAKEPPTTSPMVETASATAKDLPAAA